MKIKEIGPGGSARPYRPFGSVNVKLCVCVYYS